MVFIRCSFSCLFGMRCAMARDAANCADMIEFSDGPRARVRARWRGCPPRYVRSGDGRAVEQRGRLARQALKIFGKRRARSAARVLRWRAGRPRSPKRTAWRSTVRRTLAVVLMLRVLLRGVAGIGAMLMYLTMLMRRGIRMHMRGGRHPGLMHEARRGIAERQRDARREHAKQIEQGDKPPRLGAHRPRQANEHGGKLMPSADSAKGPTRH